jgi:hypothetical protein
MYRNLQVYTVTFKSFHPAVVATKLRYILVITLNHEKIIEIIML